MEEIDRIGGQLIHFFRDGTIEMFKDLTNSDTPILIISAGIGNIISAMLKKAGILTDTVKVRK